MPCEKACAVQVSPLFLPVNKSPYLAVHQAKVDFLMCHLQESKIEEDLPQKLVLVEFRSLTVTVPSKPKQKTQSISGKNFKCFRKVGP